MGMNMYCMLGGEEGIYYVPPGAGVYRKLHTTSTSTLEIILNPG